MPRTLINLESPYAGDIERNTLYARFCMRDSIVNHNESPFASHLLYTQPHILREHLPEERALGIEAGLEFARMTEKMVLYTDLGITSGMEQAIKAAEDNGIEVEMRKLNGYDWEMYFHETLSLNPDVHGNKPIPPPGKVIWEGEIPPPPEGPPNRVVNEDVPYLKYLALVFPILFFGVIVYGIAEQYGFTFSGLFTP